MVYLTIIPPNERLAALGTTITAIFYHRFGAMSTVKELPNNTAATVPFPTYAFDRGTLTDDNTAMESFSHGSLRFR